LRQTWEVLIPSSSVNTTPELRIFILTSFLRFSRHFPQINVGGDSAHLSSFGKRTREPRPRSPVKGTLRHKCFPKSCWERIWQWSSLGISLSCFLKSYTHIYRLFVPFQNGLKRCVFSKSFFWFFSLVIDYRFLVIDYTVIFWRVMTFKFEFQEFCCW